MVRKAGQPTTASTSAITIPTMARCSTACTADARAPSHTTASTASSASPTALPTSGCAANSWRAIHNSTSDISGTDVGVLVAAQRPELEHAREAVAEQEHDGGGQQRPGGSAPTGLKGACSCRPGPLRQVPATSSTLCRSKNSRHQISRFISTAGGPSSPPTRVMRLHHGLDTGRAQEAARLDRSRTEQRLAQRSQVALEPLAHGCAEPALAAIEISSGSTPRSDCLSSLLS